MPQIIRSEEWAPRGVKSLEPVADEVVRGDENTLVVAGPGSGKTELLAQRASYLLETGRCPAPRRILAISFKRDAARNLGERVAWRSGPTLARRFDSLTFDAWSKGLVDRFLNGLPQQWRPTVDYTLDFKLEQGSRLRALLDSVAGEPSGLNFAQLQALSAEKVYRSHVIGRPLPATASPPTAPADAAGRAMWAALLKGGERSLLSFAMLGCLAELVLRTNPKILRALRATYAFVFLDEFQDTTGTQYALTRTAFAGAPAVLTAVGDHKQRIMLWAGAYEGAFDGFERDFNARRRGLQMNYRSAPRLVRIQEQLIAALAPDDVPPIAADDGRDGEGECRVLMFTDHEREAAVLAEMIAAWVWRDGLQPRDICILTRQRPDIYSVQLCERLRAAGVDARVEVEYQDLLAEPVTVALLNLLALSCRPRDPGAWAATTDLLQTLAGIEGEDQRAGVINARVAEVRSGLAECLEAAQEQETVLAVLQGALEFLGTASFKHLHPQYRQGSFLTDTLQNCARLLAEARSRTATWSAALDDFRGGHALPIMTVHKSKGLEYHTVVFVGLEDSALWGWDRRPEEEKCGFFVAFSRAKKRVVFTFCERRQTNRGLQAQTRNTIAPLYDLLAAAGVETEIIN